MSHFSKRYQVVQLFLFIAFALFYSTVVFGQEEIDENTLKGYLQYSKCNFDKGAIVLLNDDYSLRFNANFELELKRKVFLKFLKASAYTAPIHELLFYLDEKLEKIDLKSAKIYSQDPQWTILSKDVTQRFYSNAKPQFEKGQVLSVEYTVKYFYTRKLPSVIVQHVVPTERFSYHFFFPDIVSIDFKLPESITADINTLSSTRGNFRMNGVENNIPFKMKDVSYSQLASHDIESFNPNRLSFSPQISIRIIELKRSANQSKGEVVSGDYGQSVITEVHKRNNIFPKLVAKFDVPKGYDSRLRTIEDKEEKLRRIFDLVRRNFRWNKADSLFIDNRKTVESIWNERKGTGSEINLALIKVLMNYGFEAYPMLVSTRKNGVINKEFAELSDFNRLIAVVYFKDKTIPLDATQTFGDFPILATDVLNTWGLSMAMSPERWVLLEDTSCKYYNTTLLLGTVINDNAFRTNVYVNSHGYSKAIRVAALEVDSIKKFIKSNFSTTSPIRHFIVANEYIDSLPLAQEFDVEIPLTKDNDLREANVNFLSFPDTLLQLLNDRNSPIDFGYIQRYEIKGEFSFPTAYQLYLLPGQIALSILNGDVVYTRSYHGTSQSFSYTSTLNFKKSFYTLSEAKEIVAFMNKIVNYQSQNVILRKTQ